MVPSPLSLKSHFFTRIEVEAHASPEGTPGDGRLSSHIECLRHEEQANVWMLQLGLKRDEVENENPPNYTYHLEVFGVFSLDERYETPDRDSFVKVNGAAVLYGAARELLATLTARGPFEAVELPTVTFVDEVDEKFKQVKKGN